MKNKIAVVTGDTGFLAPFLVPTLIKNGYFVVGISRRNFGVIENDKYEHLPFDLTGDIDLLVKNIIKKIGIPDLVINCATSYQYKKLADTSISEYENIMNINIGVPFKLIRALTPIYIKEGIIKNAFRNRSIINISSASSYSEIMKKSDKNLSVYSIAKTALNMLTEVAAKECIEFGVRVNSIAPSNFTKNDAKKNKISESIVNLANSRSNGLIIHYKNEAIN